MKSSHICLNYISVSGNNTYAVTVTRHFTYRTFCLLDSSPTIWTFRLPTS